MRRRIALWAGAWVVGFGALRLTLLAPEVCPTFTVSQAQESGQAAADWIVNNQQDTGRFVYNYDRSTDEILPGYNFVRHAGTVMSLYQATTLGLDGLLETADTGVQFLLDNAVDAGPGAVAIRGDDGLVKLGTSSILAIALVERREITGDTSFDDELRALGNFMVGQQQADGSMLNFWSIAEQAPVPGETSRFATGEALWALARMHNLWPDEGWDEPALVTLTYLATERDTDEGLWPPPWPDQWAAYSLAEMATWDLTDTHLDYARSLANRFGQMIRWDSQREGTIPKLVHLPMPRGGGYGTILEGLASLHTVASVDERLADLREGTAERLSCGAARLAEVQAVSTDPLIDGAWFYDDQTRVDDQQHALSGILLATRVLPE